MNKSGSQVPRVQLPVKRLSITYSQAGRVGSMAVKNHSIDHERDRIRRCILHISSYAFLLILFNAARKSIFFFFLTRYCFLFYKYCVQKYAPMSYVVHKYV